MSARSGKSPFSLIMYVFLTSYIQHGLSLWFPDLWTRQAPAAGPLVDFQVSEPVLTPSGASDQYGCIYTKKLMSYEFANSYGAPFVGVSFLFPRRLLAECFCQVTIRRPPVRLIE